MSLLQLNNLDFPWINPAKIWIMEGVYIDELLIYSEINDGAAIQETAERTSCSEATLQIEEMVSMFESMLTRDGSTFMLTKVEPSVFFEGEKGFRFEYERIRRVDGLRQLGFGYGSVDKNQLFTLIYQAPRLTFFPKHKEHVEAIARTAAIK